MTAPLPSMDRIRIAVIGLGYVGLPLAAAFGRHFPTLGFDINVERVAELERQHDHTLEVSSEALRAATMLSFSSDPDAPKACNVFIVTVPTPIDEFKRPDLRPLEGASRTVGRAMSRGGIVIYESTVYPGATEEICVPIIARESGLTYNQDFYAGYSPERINPGDHQHRLETIMKVTSGSTPEAAEFVDALYRRIIAEHCATADRRRLDDAERAFAEGLLASRDGRTRIVAGDTASATAEELDVLGDAVRGMDAASRERWIRYAETMTLGAGCEPASTAAVPGGSVSFLTR